MRERSRAWCLWHDCREISKSCSVFLPLRLNLLLQPKRIHGHLTILCPKNLARLINVTCTHWPSIHLKLKCIESHHLQQQHPPISLLFFIYWIWNQWHEDLHVTYPSLVTGCMPSMPPTPPHRRWLATIRTLRVKRLWMALPAMAWADNLIPKKSGANPSKWKSWSTFCSKHTFSRYTSEN